MLHGVKEFNAPQAPPGERPPREPMRAWQAILKELKEYDDPRLARCHQPVHETLHRLCSASLRLFLAGSEVRAPAREARLASNGQID